MDIETAIKAQIEPKLVHVFGHQVANAMLTRATLCYVLVDGDTPKRYGAFVHSICSDDRVVHTWGAAEAAGQESAWQGLIRSQARTEAKRQ